MRRLEGENEKSVAAQHRIEQELKHIIDESNAYRVQLSTFNKQHQATNQRLKESERRLKVKFPFLRRGIQRSFDQLCHTSITCHPHLS